MAAIRAIFFDMDDTVVDDSGSFELSIQRICNDFPHFEFRRLFSAYEGRSVPFWPSGDLRQMRIDLWRKALADSGYDPSLAEAVLESYMRHRTETCTALEGAQETLAALQGRYRLAAITNGGRDMQEPRLQITGLAGYFDVLVCASDVDAGKPDPRIFEHALQFLGLDAASTWHVGDSLSSDVAGALAAGMTAVWLNGTGRTPEEGRPEPHHEIAAVTELPRLLARAAAGNPA